MRESAHRALEGKHPMIDDISAKPADGDIGPYLHQPLPTLETAQQDRIRRQREAAVQAMPKRPDCLSGIAEIGASSVGL